MADRSQLLEQIRGGVKLRPVKMLDKSKPLILAENELLGNIIRTTAPYPDAPLLPASLDSRQNGHSACPDRIALMSEIRAGIKLRHIDAPLIVNPERANSPVSSTVPTLNKQQEQKKRTNDPTLNNPARAVMLRQMVTELKTINTFQYPPGAENSHSAVHGISLEKPSNKQATGTLGISRDSSALEASVSEKRKAKEKDAIMSACPVRSPAKMRSEVRIQLCCSYTKSPFDPMTCKKAEANEKSPPVNLVSAKSFMAVTLKEPSLKSAPWSFQTVRVSPRNCALPEKENSGLSMHSNGKAGEMSTKMLTGLAESRLLDDRMQRSKGRGVPPSLSGVHSGQERHEHNGSMSLRSSEEPRRGTSTACRSHLADNRIGEYPYSGAKQQAIECNPCEQGLTFPGLHEAANDATSAFRGIRFEIDVDDPNGSFLKVQHCPES